MGDSHSRRRCADGEVRGKVMRGLAAFEKEPPDPQRTDIIAIGLA